MGNISRELSKLMKKSTLGDYKELKRVLKYVLHTRDLVLVLVENFYKINNFITKKVQNESPLWRKFAKKSDDIVEDYVDYYWETDEEYRKSVSGWIIFVKGSSLTWGSRGQRSVTLSINTAEYVSLTEVFK